jgi:osmoprotectant transport system permease protein
VGQTSLGNYIFSGLQIEDWVSVLFGCVAAVVLALITDQLLGIIESGVAARRYRRVWIGVALLLIGVAAALLPAAGSGNSAYIVGAKNFGEQYILSAVMADRLRKQGASVEQRSGLGSAIAFRALANNEIDAYVDYSGTLWANVLGRKDSPPRAQLLEELTRTLQERYGVVVMGPLGFENAYALAMRRTRAQALGVASIADLAGESPRLKMGSDLEFLKRPEWTALRTRYGLNFQALREFQPTFMYRAITTDEVDVISAFSSDGRIEEYGLVVLEDPLEAVLPYDAVLLLAPARAADATLKRALEPLLRAIPIDVMRKASLMVDRDTDKKSPQEAAAWLAQAAHLK